MGCFAVAFPAKPVGVILGEFPVQHADFIFTFAKDPITFRYYFIMTMFTGHLLLMASYTIIFNNLNPGFFDKDDLGFGPEGKDGGMSQSIFGFKIVFIKEVIMRDMAVVAVCFAAV